MINGYSLRYPARHVNAGWLLPAILALLMVFDAGCGSSGSGDQPATEFHEDFRNKGISDLKVIPCFTGAADFMKPEPEGLRIALSDDAKPIRHRETGVSPPFDVRGDFDIVAAYETMQVDEGQGATFEIYLATQAGEALAFHRTFDSDGRGGFFITRLTTIDGKRQVVPGVQTTTPVSTSNKSGRLRITRSGADAVLCAADAGGDFQELFRVPLGTDDVVRFRVGINPRRARFAEARLVDLNVKGTLVANGIALGTTGLPRNISLWLVAGLAAVGLCLGGFWTWMRKRSAGRRGRLETTPESGQPVQPSDASP
jgi:hypothetical protein